MMSELSPTASTGRHRLNVARRSGKPYERIGPTGVLYTVIPLMCTIVRHPNGVTEVRFIR